MNILSLLNDLIHNIFGSLDVPWWVGYGLCVANSLAFISLGWQIVALAGADGIIPVRYTLARRGTKRIRDYFCLSVVWPSDRCLTIQWVSGVMLCALSLCGIVPPAFTLLVCAILYLSLNNAAPEFFRYQWDPALIETSLLFALTSPAHHTFPFALLVTLRLFLVRIDALSGWVKTSSGCPEWRDLTALKLHYWTQPLPHRLSPIFHRYQPEIAHRVATFVTKLAQIALPLVAFVPVLPLQALSFAVLAAVQVGIGITGNYGFFNVLTTVAQFALLPSRAAPAPPSLVVPPPAALSFWTSIVTSAPGPPLWPHDGVPDADLAVTLALAHDAYSVALATATHTYAPSLSYHAADTAAPLPMGGVRPRPTAPASIVHAAATMGEAGSTLASRYAREAVVANYTEWIATYCDSPHASQFTLGPLAAPPPVVLRPACSARGTFACAIPNAAWPSSAPAPLAFLVSPTFHKAVLDVFTSASSVATGVLAVARVVSVAAAAPALLAVGGEATTVARWMGAVAVELPPREARALYREVRAASETLGPCGGSGSLAGDAVGWDAAVAAAARGEAATCGTAERLHSAAHDDLAPCGTRPSATPAPCGAHASRRAVGAPPHPAVGRIASAHAKGLASARAAASAIAEPAATVSDLLGAVACVAADAAGGIGAGMGAAARRVGETVGVAPLVAALVGPVRAAAAAVWGPVGALWRGVEALDAAAAPLAAACGHTAAAAYGLLAALLLSMCALVVLGDSIGVADLSDCGSLALPLYVTLSSLRACNSFGLFASMTTTRVELQLEAVAAGDNDDESASTAGAGTTATAAAPGAPSCAEAHGSDSSSGDSSSSDSSCSGDADTSIASSGAPTALAAPVVATDAPRSTANKRSSTPTTAAAPRSLPSPTSPHGASPSLAALAQSHWSILVPRYRPTYVSEAPPYAGFHMPRVDWGTWFLPLRGPGGPVAPWYDALMDAVVLNKTCVRAFFPRIHVAGGGVVGGTFPPPRGPATSSDCPPCECTVCAAAPAPRRSPMIATSSLRLAKVRTVEYDFRFAHDVDPRGQAAGAADRPRDWTAAMGSGPDVHVGTWWRRTYVGTYGTVVTAPDAAAREAVRRAKAAEYRAQPWRDAAKDLWAACSARAGRIAATVWIGVRRPAVLFSNFEWVARTTMAVLDALLDSFLANLAAYDTIAAPPPQRRVRARRR